jgi:hypothetical protein
MISATCDNIFASLTVDTYLYKNTYIAYIALCAAAAAVASTNVHIKRNYYYTPTDEPLSGKL